MTSVVLPETRVSVRMSPGYLYTLLYNASLMHSCSGKVMQVRRCLKIILSLSLYSAWKTMALYIPESGKQSYSTTNSDQLKKRQKKREISFNPENNNNTKNII